MLLWNHNCIFHNYSDNGIVDGGAVFLYKSKGNVILTNCTFKDNRQLIVMMVVAKGYIITANSTFQNNKANTGGGVIILFGPTGSFYITSCTIKNNSNAQFVMITFPVDSCNNTAPPLPQPPP